MREGRKGRNKGAEKGDGRKTVTSRIIKSICVKSNPSPTIIEALKNVKLASGPVERAWVMKPKKGGKKKKGKNVERPRQLPYSIQSDKFFAEDKWKNAFEVWKTRFLFSFFFFLLFFFYFFSVRLNILGFHLSPLPPSFLSASIWKSYHFPYEACARA